MNQDVITQKCMLTRVLDLMDNETLTFEEAYQIIKLCLQEESLTYLYEIRDELENRSV